MPTCQNCHSTWSWKKTFKKAFTLNNAILCPDSGEKQYLTTHTRKTSSMFTSITLAAFQCLLGPIPYFQEKHGIVTGSAETAEKLSRNARYCDRLSCDSSKAVKISLEL
ncbi:hypothetical protein DYI25_18655 [Mesobacillus boroniphilus]|uniref:Uncharacterized protein n=1 Tax=Mesobacillus boroniphilus TaxID=308892 RepID=A0A944CNX6_9BACI|nr:hypothetical protein [Mesobacillus boroniphilus]